MEKSKIDQLQEQMRMLINHQRLLEERLWSVEHQNFDYRHELSEKGAELEFLRQKRREHEDGVRDAAKAAVMKDAKIRDLEQKYNELLDATRGVGTWMSPQGILYCRDNANIYGGGHDALWYLDEDKDEWMLTCWVGEDPQMKRRLDDITWRAESLHRELKSEREAVRIREDMLLSANDYAYDPPIDYVSDYDSV